MYIVHLFGLMCHNRMQEATVLAILRSLLEIKSDWQYDNDRPKFALLALLTPPVSKMQLTFAPSASEKHFEKAEHSFVY